MRLACWVLHGHFRPVYLLQASKTDDEKWWKMLLHEIIWLYENKIVAPNLDTVHWQFVSTKNTRLAKYKAGFSIQIQYTQSNIYNMTCSPLNPYLYCSNKKLFRFSAGVVEFKKIWWGRTSLQYFLILP